MKTFWKEHKDGLWMSLGMAIFFFSSMVVIVLAAEALRAAFGG